MKKYIIYAMTAVFALLVVLAACKKDDVSVTGITLSGATLLKDTLTLAVNGTATLTAAIQPDNATNKSVTWLSSNTDVAMVDRGIVVAVAEGTAVIAAITNDGNKYATCIVIVNDVSVTGVTLNKTKLALDIGQSETLIATVTPATANNKAVTWSTSNPDVATINSAGLVTAKAKGTANITVTTADGDKSATCVVTVPIIPVTGVTLNKTKLALDIGQSETLIATVLPDNATNKAVTWATDNPDIATVDNGTVTAKAAGTATITVTTVDGNKTATCAVEVYKYAQGESVVINGVRWATRNLDTGGQFVANLEDYGALFQWGRRADGHENRTSPSYPTNDGSEENGVVSELDANGQIPTTHAAYSKFIKQAASPHDWRTPQDNALWNSGTESTPMKTANDSSPAGYRVPTKVELESLANETYVTHAWTTKNGINGMCCTDKATGASLFLPAAGHRYGGNGALSYAGTLGYYWSSTPYGSGAYDLLFYSGYFGVNNGNGRAYGFSVRCVAEQK